MMKSAMERNSIRSRGEVRLTDICFTRESELTGKLVEYISGCEHDKILACVKALQEELSTTRFIVNINQLKAYCDKMAAAHS